MARVKPLPVRSRDEVLETFPAYRQSLLADFDSCPLMTRFGLEQAYDFTNPAQARGILFHRYAAEVLRTLHRTGESSIPVAEALAILYEVCEQADVPPEDVVTCPARERRLLRIAAIKLVADNDFSMQRLIDVERRLYATVSYTDRETGEVIERRVTGTPDALLADPPNGALVLDWKTTPSPPPKHDETTPTGDDAVGNVSYMGYFQQRVYALLIMRNYPSVEKVTLREFYVLKSAARNATVWRDDLEHVERELGALCAMLDRALAAGSKSQLWDPQPGKHCSYCPKPRSCPIEDEVRIAAGGITSMAQAERVSASMVKSRREYEVAREAAKGYHELTGLPIRVKSSKGRYELRWGHDSGGRRRFDLHVPDASDRGPADPNLEHAFDEAAKRKAAA